MTEPKIRTEYCEKDKMGLKNVTTLRLWNCVTQCSAVFEYCHLEETCCLIFKFVTEERSNMFFRNIDVSVK
jgi:hypothetical protein